MIKPTETLYKKVGRKYVPVAAHWSDCDGDQMAAGTFRLTYAYGDGGKRYEYEVTPDTAAAVAAMTIAKKAMEVAIAEAAKMMPSGGLYSKKELATIKEFRERMGGMFPCWWHQASAHDIADAAIKAVDGFKP